MEERSFRCRVSATCSFRAKRRLPSLCLALQVIIALVALLLSGCAPASTRGSKATTVRRGGASFKSPEPAAATTSVPRSLEETRTRGYDHQRLRPGNSHGRSQQQKQPQERQRRHKQKQRQQKQQEEQEQQQHQQQQQQQEQQKPLPSPARPRAFFVTYGSGKYALSMARLVQEAKGTGEFDVVHGFTRKDIDQDFARANAGTLSQKRGDGFWLWKPYFVRRVMREEMQPGDVLFYADAGCEFKGSPRPYLDLARRYGFLGFRLSYAVKHWTKGDVFRALDMDMGTFGDERQMVGGIFAMMKTPSIARFVDEWLHFARQPQLVDDSPSAAPNAPGFVEHRHDQAIFTLLVYKHGLALVLEDETDKAQYITGLHHFLSTSEWYKETRVIFAARGKNDLSKQEAKIPKTMGTKKRGIGFLKDT